VTVSGLSDSCRPTSRCNGRRARAAAERLSVRRHLLLLGCTMKRRCSLRALFPVVAVVVAVACDDSAGVLCLQGYNPTIEVEVWDAAADLPAAQGAYGAAWSRSELDSLIPAPGASGDTLLLLLSNRPGTYDVEVRKAGFSDWDTSGVVIGIVGGEHCGTVGTAHIVARLDSL